MTSAADRPMPRWPASALACLLAGAGPALAQPATADSLDTDFARQVDHAVNQYRQARQLPALVSDPALVRLAAAHSAQMAHQGGLSHAGFAERFRQAQRNSCVENLAAGFSQAGALVAGWQGSPSHHRNLLDSRVLQVGVASVRGHVTWLACSGPAAAGR